MDKKREREKWRRGEGEENEQKGVPKKTVIDTPMAKLTTNTNVTTPLLLDSPALPPTTTAPGGIIGPPAAAWGGVDWVGPSGVNCVAVTVLPPQA